MKGIVVIAGCIGLGLGIGYMVGKRGQTSGSSPKGEQTSIPSEPPAANSSEESLLSHCFLNNSAQDEIFNIEGKTITFSELPADFRSSYLNNMEESYRRHLDLIQKTAIRLRLAKDEGKMENISELPTIEQLLPGKMEVTEKEVKEYYDANKSGFPKNMTYEKVKMSLENHLISVKKKQVQDGLKSLIEDNTKISWNISPQCPPRFKIDTSGFPVVGAGTAPNEVLFVTDLMCPECRVVWPKLDAVQRASGERIKIIPILQTAENNQYSSEYNRALFCASKEGADKFSQFVNLAHTIPINYQNDLAKIKDHIKSEIGQQLQIAPEAFENCMRSPEADTFVQKVVAVSKNTASFRLPTIFLNGRTIFAGNTSESSTDLLKKVLGI